MNLRPLPPQVRQGRRRLCFEITAEKCENLLTKQSLYGIIEKDELQGTSRRFTKNGGGSSFPRSGREWRFFYSLPRKGGDRMTLTEFMAIMTFLILYADFIIQNKKK